METRKKGNGAEWIVHQDNESLFCHKGQEQNDKIAIFSPSQLHQHLLPNTITSKVITDVYCLTIPQPFRYGDNSDNMLRK